MAKLYVNSMAFALKSFHKNMLKKDYEKYETYFGNKPSDDFYLALAYQGLSNHGVEAWNNLSEERRAKAKKPPGKNRNTN